MEVKFKDQKLKKLCEQQRLAIKTLGAPCARKLRSRLADLCSVASVVELNVGNPHPLKGDRLGEFVLDLHGGFRLVFEPANQPIPQEGENEIDWHQVTEVWVVFIGDYHD